MEDLLLYLFIVPLILAVGALVVIGAIRKPPYTITGHWQTFLDGFNVPTKDFYTSVVEGINARQLPKVAFTQEAQLEKHLLSDRRLYLRIAWSEYIYYICCAPYGTGTFISSWLCIKEETILNHIPVLSKLFGLDRSRKTFYQMDTEAMFQSSVHASVVDAVNSISEARGLRGLTELEQQFKEVR